MSELNDSSNTLKMMTQMNSDITYVVFVPCSEGGKTAEPNIDEMP